MLIVPHRLESVHIDGNETLWRDTLATAMPPFTLINKLQLENFTHSIDKDLMHIEKKIPLGH
jgi:hypothetical protein